MHDASRWGRTLAFAGFLLGFQVAFFPMLGDYRYFTGLECAFFFLNREDSLPAFFLIAAFLLASGLGIAFVLLRWRKLPLLVPALSSLTAGLWLSWLFAFKLAPLGWAALVGATLQSAGAAVVFVHDLAARRRNA
jgi:hypothetical protein